MLRGGEVKDIQELKRQALSISQISAHTGFDAKTIRKYLQDPKRPHYGPRQHTPSKLDPFKAYLEQRLQSGVWNAVVLLRELKEKGYTGGYSILRDQRLSASPARGGPCRSRAPFRDTTGPPGAGGLGRSGGGAVPRRTR